MVMLAFAFILLFFAVGNAITLCLFNDYQDSPKFSRFGLFILIGIGIAQISFFCAYIIQYFTEVYK